MCGAKGWRPTSQPFLPLLKRLSFRFPRPLITWDIFSQEAPSSFPTSGGKDQEQDSTREGQFGSEKLRDPREVNHVVHKGQTQGQWKKGQQTMEAEGYAAQNAGVLDPADLKAGKLYIVKLDTPDGEFSLGLVRLEAATNEETFKVHWFERVGRGHCWRSDVKFQRYMDKETWISDDIPPNCFLLDVEDDDLTDSSPQIRDTNPTLASRFVHQIRGFAVAHGHGHGDPKARKKAAAPSKSNAKPAGKPPPPAANCAKPAAKPPPPPAKGANPAAKPPPPAAKGAKPAGKAPPTATTKRVREEGTSAAAKRPRRTANK